MRLERLALEQFRLFDRVDLSLEQGLNVFVGGNGAGKTSILEAIYLLAYGRSFRGAVRDGLVKRGESVLRVFAEVRGESGELSRIGLERGAKEWQGRIDGRSLTTLSELYLKVGVVCFEPGSHELIAGGAENRRRYLDWTLFHVEPEFIGVWRRYQRALKQRNTLLKSGLAAVQSEALDAWDMELAEAGEKLTHLRLALLERLRIPLRSAARHFLEEAGEPALVYQRGWGGNGSLLLSDALHSARARDLVLGHTSVGPHRADWSISYESLPVREMFSRGQEKLTALACICAQAECFAAARGEWPVLCLDDLNSELDRPHTELAFDWLSRASCQILLTGTEAIPALINWPNQLATFHVEQGKIGRLL